eukprot:TRINITY_DN6797_c0_g1_i2.p1 TRINITY_DN6797_c0_g1~~TRINITY_DN6797_c0_g1_i2.p1  ORF type:complete len:994 (-),score=128.61 TRINITY_DN6797_c0_g1_i2:18-2999(-)
MSRHLRNSAHTAEIKLSYDNAERTYKHANSLLRRRPRMFDVMDKALLANEEALAHILEMRGNYSDAISKFQNAMAFHPRYPNPGSLRFYVRLSKLQNHMAQGRCFFKSQQSDLALMELENATKSLRSLSWSFNVVSTKRWNYLVEIEREIQFLKALVVNFADENSVEVSKAIDKLITLMDEYNPEITLLLQSKIDEELPPKILAKLKEMMLAEKSKSFPVQALRAASVVFATANMYRRGADFQEFTSEKEAWLRCSLYLHLAVIPFFKELAYKSPAVSPSVVTIADRFNEMFWPPSIIESGSDYSPEIIFQKLISASSTLAQVRIQLHHCTPLPGSAKEHAEKAYLELVEAYTILSKRLHNRDLALKSRLTMWLGAASRRTHRGHEARHAYKMASSLIAILPKSSDGYVMSVRLSGLAHMYTGLMHLGYGEFPEAKISFQEAYNVYFNNVDEMNRKEFGDVLNCMGLWHLHQGDYLRALVHFQSAERYAMMYSNSQDTMANQMKVYNIVDRPVKALKQLKNFLGVRIGYRIGYASSLIEELTHHQEQLVELKPQWSEKNHHLYQDLQSRKETLIQLVEKLSKLKQIFESTNDLNSAINPNQGNPSQSPWKDLLTKDLFTLESVPLLNETALSFYLIEDHWRSALCMQIIRSVICNEEYKGMMRVEMFIQYLINSAEINTKMGLYCAANLQTTIAKQLIEKIYKFKYQQNICIKSLLASAIVVLQKEWLCRALRNANISIERQHKSIDDPVEDWLLNFYNTGMDVGAAWTKISDAMYYTSIAFAPTTYNMAECREWLGHYYLITGEFNSAKENFTVAFNAIKDKLGADAGNSLRFANLMNVSDSLDAAKLNQKSPQKKIIGSKTKKIHSYSLGELYCWLGKASLLAKNLELTKQFNKLIRGSLDTNQAHPFGIVSLSYLVIITSGEQKGCLKENTDINESRKWKAEASGLLDELLKKDIEECKRIWEEEAFLFKEWITLEDPRKRKQKSNAHKE